VDRLEHRGARRVDVAAGSEPKPALDHGAEVGDDVAEHVRGDDDVEPLGVLDEPHRDGVDEVELRRDVRVAGGNVREDVPPEAVDVGEDVRFVDRSDLFLPLCGKVESVSDRPLRTRPGDDADLVGELVGVGLDVQPEPDVVEVADDLKSLLLVFPGKPEPIPT
jgi:hypothetical protein